jgi:hypothetical protein
LVQKYHMTSESNGACGHLVEACATSWKVTGLIPDGVIGIFHSGRTMALGLTQPVTEIVPGIFPGGKGGRCVRLTNLTPSCANCLEMWES